MNNKIGYLSADIISVPGSEQFPERVAQRKLCTLGNRLCPRTNIRVHSRPKWRLLCLLSFKINIFCSTHCSEDWGRSLGYSPALAGEYIVM